MQTRVSSKKVFFAAALSCFSSSNGIYQGSAGPHHTRGVQCPSRSPPSQPLTNSYVLSGFHFINYIIGSFVAI